MTWSRGLRERLLPFDAEQSDEELAEAADLQGETLLAVKPSGLRRLSDFGLTPTWVIAC
ncbi:MAG: hypothetical protein QOH56_3439 [Pseudonocardiales bacterium]|jgi:hypothetical protein|nr:hypothetical protein [Pseudonocardiales bacterium]